MTAAPATPTVNQVFETIDRLMTEGLIGFSRVAKSLGAWRLGRPCSPATITRWFHEGVKLPGGDVVKLQAVRVGGKLMTSQQAVFRFVARQNEPGNTVLNPRGKSSPAFTEPKRRSHDAAKRKLAAAGC